MCFGLEFFLVFLFFFFFFFNDTATTEIYTLSLHDALPICRVLIYPEGHLAPLGYHFRYKPGVWHMQTAMDVPIVPVATNLNCFWQQEEIAKKPGKAVIEFLEPIPAGLPKDEAIKLLTERVETRSAELIAEALGRPVEPSKLLPDPDKGTIGKPDSAPKVA